MATNRTWGPIIFNVSKKERIYTSCWVIGSISVYLFITRKINKSFIKLFAKQNCFKNGITILLSCFTFKIKYLKIKFLQDFFKKNLVKIFLYRFLYRFPGNNLKCSTFKTLQKQWNWKQFKRPEKEKFYQSFQRRTRLRQPKQSRLRQRSYRKSLSTDTCIF